MASTRVAVLLAIVALVAICSTCSAQKLDIMPERHTAGQLAHTGSLRLLHSADLISTMPAVAAGSTRPQARKLQQNKPNKPASAKSGDSSNLYFKRLEKSFSRQP